MYALYSKSQKVDTDRQSVHRPSEKGRGKGGGGETIREKGGGAWRASGENRQKGCKKGVLVFGEVPKGAFCASEDASRPLPTLERAKVAIPDQRESTPTHPKTKETGGHLTISKVRLLISPIPHTHTLSRPQRGTERPAGYSARVPFSLAVPSLFTGPYPFYPIPLPDRCAVRNAGLDIAHGGCSLLSILLSWGCKSRIPLDIVSGLWVN